MTIEYTPSHTPGRDSAVSRVRKTLAATSEKYGAYVFSNTILSMECDLPMKQLVPTLRYLALTGEWVAQRGAVTLKADPTLDGRQLRRGTVLVRGVGREVA